MGVVNASNALSSCPHYPTVAPIGSIQGSQRQGCSEETFHRRRATFQGIKQNREGYEMNVERQIVNDKLNKNNQNMNRCIYFTFIMYQTLLKVIYMHCLILIKIITSNL